MTDASVDPLPRRAEPGTVHPAVAAARRIADDVLFPRALATDAADLVPVTNLDALAASGLYGMAGRPDYEGAPVDLPAIGYVIEALAGGCLSTAFVWIQHNGAVRALAETTNTALREACFEDMCAGRVRAGLALGGMRDPAQLRASPAAGGWLVDGVMPWVTGWGRIDLLFVTALAEDGRTMSAFVEAKESAELAVRRLKLVGANASGTVEATFAAYFVPDERVTSLNPFVAPPPHDGGGRFNGSLSLGLAARCVRMIGESPLDAELVACRDRLDAADELSMGDARAAATELAMRSAVSLVVTAGSRSLLADQHGQRLVREATFLLGFGTRPSIKAGLLGRLGANTEG